MKNISIMAMTKLGKKLWNLTPDRIDAPGKAYTLYMNDDNCCWIHINFQLLKQESSSTIQLKGRWDNGRSGMDR